jgi:flagellar biosynthesis protein FlhF
MHIKRVVAPTMAEAVERVKAELGPEALVLETRNVRREGVLGRFARPLVEIVAGVDREPAPQPAAERAVAPDESWRELRVGRALIDPLEAELRALRRSVEAWNRAQGEPAVLLEELAALRRAAQAAYGALPAAESGGALGAELRSAGVHPETAVHLVHVAGERARQEGGSLRDALVFELAVRMEPRMVVPRDDLGRRVELFVGPTGVGKTTSVAKLAARRHSDENAVALVSTDGFRVGAEAQLRTFAELLRVPFSTALSPAELVRRIEGLRGRRILVDTAGRAHSDREGMDELVRAREALGSRARVHLVLDATRKDADLRREVARFRVLRPDALVVTKVDESRDLGNVVNLVLDPSAPPLAWIADGQRVPEDLRVADPLELASAVLRSAA